MARKRKYSDLPEEQRERERAGNRAYKSNNREAINAQRRAGYIANKEFFLTKAKRWYLENRDKALAKSVVVQLAKFGLTLDSYKEILDSQNGMCAICGKTDDGAGRRLAIDHNHLTLEIRGLLCIGCNIGLGQFKENPALMMKAIGLPTKSAYTVQDVESPRKC